jgi:hypothetical protein
MCKDREAEGELSFTEVRNFLAYHTIKDWEDLTQLAQINYNRKKSAENLKQLVAMQTGLRFSLAHESDLITSLHEDWGSKSHL